MARGHLGSVELIRNMCNPSMRRNVSTAITRYAANKDGKKSDGVFSWLKYMFKSDDRIQETRNAGIGGGAVTVFNYPGNNQACLGDFKLGYLDEQGFIEETIYNRRCLSVYDGYDLRRDFGYDILAMSERIDNAIRIIMGCRPRNTKPPIREPNMPEKQEKKDQKKEKKKKKPVIRMEGSSSESSDTLHDNLDVKFHQKWDAKGEAQKGKSAQPANPSLQVPVYDVGKMHVVMRASDTDKSKKSLGLKSKQKVGDSENSSKLTTISPRMSSDSNIVDEEYASHIPFDAEVSAWKDLVTKSKIPLDPSKGELLDDGRHAEMLSIRPEPPQPKLDVQAIPTTKNPSTAEEDDEELSEIRINPKIDTGRTSQHADVQKLDNKKLHTGTLGFSRNGVQFLRRSGGPYGSSRVFKTLVSPRSIDFSTNTESGWERMNQTAAKKAEPTESASMLDQKPNMEAADGLADKQVGANSPQERLANYEQAKQTDMGQDFKGNLARIPDRDVDIPLNRSHGEDRDEHRISFESQSRRNLEDDDYIRPRPDDFQASFDYANNAYEDDFYPGYEPMSLDPIPERTNTDRSKDLQQDKIIIGNVPNEETDMEFREEDYVSDGNYIRLPGDPYPYSREHFHKWHGGSRPSSRQIDQSTERKIHTDSHILIDEAEKTTEKAPDKGTALPETTQSADANLKKSQESKSEDIPAPHVETIHPDIHQSNHEVNANPLQRFIKSKLRGGSQKANDDTLAPENMKSRDIHALRNEQLSLVTQDEIDEIYESKNYVHLRAEEMKNVRLNLKSKSDTNEQDSSL